MSCEKCSKSKGLCPVSLGLALGITAALIVLGWGAWMMYYGVSPEMASHLMAADLTWGRIGLFALWALIKGFVVGFLIALFYDLISCCCCRCKCCRKGSACVCGDKDKPEVK